MLSYVRVFWLILLFGCLYLVCANIPIAAQKLPEMTLEERDEHAKDFADQLKEMNLIDSHDCNQLFYSFVPKYTLSPNGEMQAEGNMSERQLENLAIIIAGFAEVRNRLTLTKSGKLKTKKDSLGRPIFSHFSCAKDLEPIDGRVSTVDKFTCRDTEYVVETSEQLTLELTNLSKFCLGISNAFLETGSIKGMSLVFKPEMSKQ